jgi:6-pyruvoyltetrahydropterin/6-carboxytetrahydropterin synthase
MPEFHIRVAGDDLTFSAAHFITLEDGSRERLHGHTFHVAVEVFGPLNDSGYVGDYHAVAAVMRKILDGWDHRVLLPLRHPSCEVSTRSDEIEATFGDRRWVFPKDDCVVLPIVNTTSELLAQQLAERLAAALGPVGRMRIVLEEGTGRAAVCELA